MNDAELKQWLYRYGHFAPDVGEDDLDKLSMEDEPVIKAVKSIQELDGNLPLLVAKHHGRSRVYADGDAGPATRELAELPRCGMSDTRPETQQGEEAVGRGNWPRCHGIGDFHAVIVQWENNIPNFFNSEEWRGVLKQSRDEYAKLGLWCYNVDRRMTDLLTGEKIDGPVNIDASFVNSSNGWIGLAILGYGQGCRDNIWCRYLRTWRSSAQEWAKLVMHEIGHNCGLDHSNGGIMNPSVSRGPALWTDSDPSTPLLKRKFGGEPVDKEPPDDPDGPDDPNGNGCTELLNALRDCLQRCGQGGNDEDWGWD